MGGVRFGGRVERRFEFVRRDQNDASLKKEPILTS